MAAMKAVGSGTGGDEGRSPRLLDQVRGRMRRLGMAKRSEEVYVGWIRRFILSNDKRHPAEMGAEEVERFLTALAVHGQVSASTQNQALSALLFLYKQVLAIDLPWLDGVERAKKPQRLPVVLTSAEVAALLGELHGIHWLMGSLLYGTGMRLMECVRLRVKDVDFEQGEIVIRQGKGGKDRRTVLPRSLHQALQAQLAEASRMHERDKAAGLVMCGCLMRWRGNIRPRRRSAGGSMFFRHRFARWTHAMAWNVAIIWTNRRCSAR
jgi:integrase